MFALLRQLGYLATVAVACLYVFIALRGPNGLPTIFEKQRQIEQMRQDNEHLRQEIENKRKSIEALESSPEAKDGAVRQHTKKAMPHDTTVILTDPGTRQPDSRPETALPATR